MGVMARRRSSSTRGQAQPPIKRLYLRWASTSWTAQVQSLTLRGLQRWSIRIIRLARMDSTRCVLRHRIAVRRPRSVNSILTRSRAVTLYTKKRQMSTPRSPTGPSCSCLVAKQAAAPSKQPWKDWDFRSSSRRSANEWLKSGMRSMSNRKHRSPHWKPRQEFSANSSRSCPSTVQSQIAKIK